MLVELAYTALGGAAGALLRVLLDSLYDPALYSLYVNIGGCFIMGVVSCCQGHGLIDTRFYRYFLKIGLIGSFTTITVICWALLHLSWPLWQLTLALMGIIAAFTADCALGHAMAWRLLGRRR
ncbi:MAG: CrcB family protein [Succinivibrionaceae bacterium]|nr:CrcB family protein [Succinivibrionaceae bacterium]